MTKRTHWRCAHAPADKPLKKVCPVHDAQRPLVLAECLCKSVASCEYCGGQAYRYDPFGGRPCCLKCFDQIIGGSE